jgi:hypothetical protein
MPAATALGALALFAADTAAATPPPYSPASTYACLARLPDSIVGLPPATPPVPPALFVDALDRDAASTWGFGRRPRMQRQLGVWYGTGTYRGIILSFFRSVSDARTSLKTLAGLYGGKLLRNVVVTWDQKPAPSVSVRAAVFACLRPDTAGRPARPKRPPPPASLATFAGRWGGHTRGLSITTSGRGREFADDGCCTRMYGMTFRILSVSGTVTRAVALYRVLSFRRYGGDVAPVRAGDVGRLRLSNGIVTNTLTRVYFCSDPAWGATGACGA